MKKRLLSALLAAVMVLTLLPSAALAATTREDAAQVLAALDIMVGDQNGNLNLTSPVTRAEFVKMLMAASPVSVGDETAVSPYPDVPRAHWAAPYVEAAVAAGYVNGYLDGTFRPGKSISLAEGVTMALRLLGYQPSDFSGSFPAGQMAMYRTLDLDESIALGQNDTMTRQDAMYLFYNLLTANSKLTGMPYLSSVLGHSLSADGKVDTLALLNETMDGPVVVGERDWQEKIAFDYSKATVNRNGSITTANALTSNDVVYHSKSMNTLWVYTNRVTGTIQTVTPSSAPSSVTVAGKTYAIETSAAAYAVSDLGTFDVGDAVTLLLGRDSKVVSVLSPTQTSGIVCGLVISAEPQSYEDKDGHSYTAYSLTVLATDGNTYVYRYDKGTMNAGAVVQVTSNGTDVQIKTISASLSGKVNGDGTKLGKYSFASDVEILDTFNSAGVRVYPSRLAGVTLDSSMVRYYLLNSSGEISRLILKDATGDMHTYGVVTKVSEVSPSGVMVTSGVYIYDAGGIPGQISSARVFNVKKGPFLLKMDGIDIDRFANLTEVKVSSVDGNTLYAGNQQYALSDDVLVYEIRNDEYYLSSLSLVTGGDYTLTGWYDKAQSEGGRIRVIIAK